MPDAVHYVCICPDEDPGCTCQPHGARLQVANIELWKRKLDLIKRKRAADCAYPDIAAGPYRNVKQRQSGEGGAKKRY